MSDEPQSPPPAADAPEQSALDTPPSPPEPDVPPPPPVDFGTQDAMAEEPPLNFGEQLMTKGGLPKDLETRIEEIEKGPSKAGVTGRS
jgi:hypothetical protein